MKFTNDEENRVILQADTGHVFTFDFDQEGIDLDNESSISMINDTIKGLFILWNGRYMSLASVQERAQSHYDDICEEDRINAKAEQAMNEELACPYLTGRI